MAKKKKKDQQPEDQSSQWRDNLFQAMMKVPPEVVQQVIGAQIAGQRGPWSDDEEVSVTSAYRKASASTNVKRAYASESMSFCINPDCKDGILIIVPDPVAASELREAIDVDEMPIQLSVIRAHTQEVLSIMFDLESLKDHVNKCQEAIALGEKVQEQIRNG